MRSRVNLGNMHYGGDKHTSYNTIVRKESNGSVTMFFRFLDHAIEISSRTNLPPEVARWLGHKLIDASYVEYEAGKPVGEIRVRESSDQINIKEAKGTRCSLWDGGIAKQVDPDSTPRHRNKCAYCGNILDDDEGDFCSTKCHMFWKDENEEGVFK